MVFLTVQCIKQLQHSSLSIKREPFLSNENPCDNCMKNMIGNYLIFLQNDRCSFYDLKMRVCFSGPVLVSCRITGRWIFLMLLYFPCLLLLEWWANGFGEQLLKKNMQRSCCSSLCQSDSICSHLVSPLHGGEGDPGQGDVILCFHLQLLH